MSQSKDVIRRMFSEIINNGKVDLVDELFDVQNCVNRRSTSGAVDP